MVFHERGFSGVLPTEQVIDLFRFGRTCFRALVVGRVAVFVAPFGCGCWFAREGWRGVIALFDIGVEQRFEEFERAAPIRDHVRDFQVDAVAEIGHTHEDAIEIGVEPSADRQAFGLYLRDFISWFEVVPE